MSEIDELREYYENRLSDDHKYFKETLDNQSEIHHHKTESLVKMNEMLIKRLSDRSALEPPKPMMFCAKCSKDLNIYIDKEKS